MAEFPYFRPSGAWKVKAKGIGSSSPSREQNDPRASKYCAYNQTRQRFLCANVQAANYSATDFGAQLLQLTPGSDAGLWIVPIQNISPTNIRVPLDLIYLDRNSVVLDAVESFPLSQSTASIGSATSILALPAQAVSSTGTQLGDRLILCPPEEMKLRLQAISDPDAGARWEQSAASNLVTDAGNDRISQKPAGNVIPFVDRSNAASVSNAAPIAIDSSIDAAIAPAAFVIAPTGNAPTVYTPPLAPVPPQPAMAAPRSWKAPSPAKSWLTRLISPSQPADPRKAPRTELTWLVAYFFTGGRSLAHAIRDISATGMFVFTEARWYPGTVVRMTLTDKRNQIEERSLTINAEAIRSANDGVGFRFVLKDAINSRDAFISAVDRHAQGLYRNDVEAFLSRISSGAQ